ncbi:flagellar export protein FliJ [Asticcacaulis sp. AC402]|uniref:flagellar export protein FliJ n=1 Tax=Asticcacaulis sp. AC402 TaxID=1282361 RepID=UPI0003C41240|nr:flagellar export protein FliJ [Asticcacaulis sp. AC402]ESQ76006.1 flagellar export protein FliJ [Asticcacaulis sp. AC402]
MTKWAKSLIRISTFEVETLQKRLAEVVTRRTHVEMKVATLDAEFELECVKAGNDVGMAYSLNAYKRGFKLRRDAAIADLELLAREEDGVRDQLGMAFEDLKKFEHVAEVTKLRREAAFKKAENAALDEAALRIKRA